MNKIEALLKVLGKKQKADSDDTPEGFCPNCWGRQEYGNQFYDAAINHKVNVFDSDAKVGWIQDYVNKNLSPIELKKSEEGLVCANCKITYRPN